MNFSDSPPWRNYEWIFNIFLAKWDFTSQIANVANASASTDISNMQIQWIGIILGTGPSWMRPFKTQSYGNSFLPSSVREWNRLSEDIWTADYIQTFKNRVDPNKKNSKCFIRYSNLGRRFGQIILARCRLGCSDLNADKFNRFLIENSSCSCGHIYEDPTHFFLYCRHYDDIRANSFCHTWQLPISTILSGSDDMSLENLELLSVSVHNFIIQSQRFPLSTIR